MRTGSPAMFVGIGLAVAGFTAITLAWDGAASLDYVQGQFPYLLSGGLAGLGLIVVGITVVAIQVLRVDAAQRDAELERLTDAVAALHKALSPTDPFDPEVTGEYRPRPRRPALRPAPQPPAASGTGPRPGESRAGA